LSAAGGEITLRGATSDVSCFEKVFIYSEYSSPFDHSPQVIVDAGANVGMATLYFANRYPTARILAIEPEPKNFKMLQRNCARLPNVVLAQAALWPEDRRLTIASSSVGEWAYSVTERSATTESRNEVSAITVEVIFRRLEINKIDLLKLDIEGSERELFSNAEGWLDRVEYIVIELHDRYRPGCAKAFYSAIATRKFIQEARGEHIFVRLG
jgi:FkbM family methyltransferase